MSVPSLPHLVPRSAAKTGTSGELWTALVVPEDMGDAPVDISTPYAVDIGDTFQGNLQPSGERDWIRLDLAQGDTVTLSLTGDTLPDPHLRLRDAQGTLVAENDDFIELDSQLSYTSHIGGTYYIEAGSYNDLGGGTYTLDVTLPDPIAPYDPLQALDWGPGATVPGTGPGGGTIEVYFAPAGETHDGVTSEGFNAYEIQQFELAFDLFESVTALTFTVTANAAAADFTLVLDTDGEISSLGYFFPPGSGASAGIGVFNAQGQGWSRSAGGGLEQGGYGFVTIVHELGHGLGLAHPHDTGGGSTILPGVINPTETGAHLLNQGIFTTMSYVDGFAEGPVGSAASTLGYGYQGGPMALDLALLQSRYGADTATGTGDTLYALPGANLPGTFWQTIWDSAGQDTLSHSGSTAAVIDLRAASLQDALGGGGFVSAVAGVQGGFTIAHGVVIEHASGGNGADVLIGNDAANDLTGHAGADTILGARGDDLILGGAQNDSLLGERGFDTLDGGDGDDTLLGGNGDDSLTGDTGDDFIQGSLGSDTLSGNGGHDTLNGGTGADTVRGGSGADSMTGGGGADLVEGGTGDDTLRGANGTDTIHGEDGNDLILGEARNDYLDGGIGNDTLRGGDAGDTLVGGAGDDDLRGENNADLFVFEDGFGSDRIRDFDADNTNEDIDLSGVTAITDYADLLANHMTQSGGNVIIEDGLGNRIRVDNVQIGDMNNSDFLF